MCVRGGPSGAALITCAGAITGFGFLSWVEGVWCTFKRTSRSPQKSKNEFRWLGAIYHVPQNPQK
jgi:hypothetical protein